MDALILRDNDVVVRIVSRDHHYDVFMLRNQLVPHMVSVVFAAVTDRRADVIDVEGGSVAEQVCVSGDDDVVSGVRGDNLARPIENLVGRSEIKRHNEVLVVAHYQLLPGVEHIAAIASADDVGVFVVIKCTDEFGHTVMVAANYRIGDKPVELENVVRCKSPFGRRV